MTRESLSKLGSRLIFLGFALSFIGFALVMVGTYQFPSSSSASTGIVIFIGPIPIVLGTGPLAPLLIILGLFVTVVVLLLLVLLRSRPIKVEDAREPIPIEERDLGAFLKT